VTFEEDEEAEGMRAVKQVARFGHLSWTCGPTPFSRAWPGELEWLERPVSSAEPHREINEQLAALFLPEKQRLQQTMRDAIRRMLEIAYGDAIVSS
jgi:hypothetical protein